MKLLVLFLSLILVLGCTNYSVSKSKTVPPILVSIAPISGVTGGYTIKMRITNQEPFLAGYKVYVGATENASRNPADLNSGFSCSSGPSIIPNQPIRFSSNPAYFYSAIQSRGK